MTETIIKCDACMRDIRTEHGRYRLAVKRYPDYLRENKSETIFDLCAKCYESFIIDWLTKDRCDNLVS